MAATATPAWRLRLGAVQVLGGEQALVLAAGQEDYYKTATPPTTTNGAERGERCKQVTLMDN